VPRLRELVDLIVGAAASLMVARQLGYIDRSEPLPDDYYEHLSLRTRRMAEGTLPPHGRWISGYYFNSGLMRLWAARDQLQRIQEVIARRKGQLSKLRLDSPLRADA